MAKQRSSHTPPHIPHCSECHGKLARLQLRGVLELEEAITAMAWRDGVNFKRMAYKGV